MQLLQVVLQLSPRRATKTGCRDADLDDECLGVLHLRSCWHQHKDAALCLMAVSHSRSLGSRCLGSVGAV